MLWATVTIRERVCIRVRVSARSAAVVWSRGTLPTGLFHYYSVFVFFANKHVHNCSTILCLCCACRHEGLLPGREVWGALFLWRSDWDATGGLRPHAARPLRRAGHGIHRLQYVGVGPGRRPLLRAPDVWHHRARSYLRVDETLPRAQVIPARQLHLH